MTQEEDSFLQLLMAVAGLIDRRCDQYLTRHHAMTMPQYLALVAIQHGQARTVGQLADALNCSRGNLTGVADRLERDGRIVRNRNTQDRRVIEVALTAKGQRVVETQAGVARELGKLQSVWSEGEAAVVKEGLERLLTELTAEGAQLARQGA